MIRALYTAGTGMRVQQTNVDVIANNLANVNTTGYKRTQANFQDLLYVTLRASGGNSAGPTSPTGVQIGSGAELVSTAKVFSNGVLEPTGRALDVAIQGEGFFEVQHPSGETAYTRDGAFRRAGDGTLTTAQGYSVQGGAITVPPDAQSITLAPDGTISYIDASGASQQLAQMQVAMFPNPAGLRAAGGNLFFETEASGAAVVTTPSLDGAGTLTQGHLEKSNVDVVQELIGLITAQRAYEVNSRAISAGDEMLREVNTLVR